jgi:hypothetical protein
MDASSIAIDRVDDGPVLGRLKSTGRKVSVFVAGSRDKGDANFTSVLGVQGIGQEVRPNAITAVLTGIDDVVVVVVEKVGRL